MASDDVAAAASAHVASAEVASAPYGHLRHVKFVGVAPTVTVYTQLRVVSEARGVPEGSRRVSGTGVGGVVSFSQVTGEKGVDQEG